MKNNISIVTDDFAISGTFKGSIKYIDSEYTFGGFLNVYDNTKNIDEQYNQICTYFFPSFMQNERYIDNINWDENENLAIKLNKEYDLFLKKVGMISPKEIFSKYIWGIACADDMLGVILNAIYECLQVKNTLILYDVYIDDVPYDCYGNVKNNFYKIIKIS